MPRLRAAILVAAVVLLLGPVSVGAGAASSGTSTPPPAAGAVLELTEVTHALQERTLVISGWVRNAGRLPVAGLVIDASGFAPVGDLAAFGSDGIPWSMRPGSAEHFQIFLPLSRTLVSSYTVTISASRPRQARASTVTRSIFPAFYRPLILPRVQVDVETGPTVLIFTASADGLPVAAVQVTVNLLVREKHDIVLRVLTVEVPVGRPLRLGFAPLIVRVVSVTVADVILSPSWASS